MEAEQWKFTEGQRDGMAACLLFLFMWVGMLTFSHFDLERAVEAKAESESPVGRTAELPTMDQIVEPQQGFQPVFPVDSETWYSLQPCVPFAEPNSPSAKSWWTTVADGDRFFCLDGKIYTGVPVVVLAD